MCTSGCAHAGIALSPGAQLYAPADPTGEMFFTTPATFAEFEVALLRIRTKGDLTAALVEDELRGMQPSSYQVLLEKPLLQVTPHICTR